MPTRKPVEQQPDEIPDHDPTSVTSVPVGAPTARPVVGQPWQPPIPIDNPLDADPLV